MKTNTWRSPRLKWVEHESTYKPNTHPCLKTQLNERELKQAQELLWRICCGAEQGVQTGDDCKRMGFELHLLLTGEEHEFAKYFKKKEQ